MKKKTWIITLMAMVFMACFGFAFMKKLMEPADPVQMEPARGFGQESVDGDDGKRPEDRNVDSLIKTATVRRKAGGHEKVYRLEETVSRPVDPSTGHREGRMCPKACLATDLHYQAPRQVTAVRHSSCCGAKRRWIISTFRNTGGISGRNIEEKAFRLAQRDITMNGERMNGRTGRTSGAGTDAGIQVLVIPATTISIMDMPQCITEQKIRDSIRCDGFYEIYQVWMGNQALSRDILSYVYGLDEKAASHAGPQYEPG